jgi:hypothetical protein
MLGVLRGHFYKRTAFLLANLIFLQLTGEPFPRYVQQVYLFTCSDPNSFIVFYTFREAQLEANIALIMLFYSVIKILHIYFFHSVLKIFIKHRKAC